MLHQTFYEDHANVYSTQKNYNTLRRMGEISCWCILLELDVFSRQLFLRPKTDLPNQDFHQFPYSKETNVFEKNISRRVNIIWVQRKLMKQFFFGDLKATTLIASSIIFLL